MKHAIRNIHFVEHRNLQPKPGLQGAASAMTAKCTGGLTG
jgi:hypothetical protein